LAEDQMEEQPCSAREPDDATRICVSDVGHKGRHRFRHPAVANGLAN
jgi:hypothetical protein